MPVTENSHLAKNGMRVGILGSATVLAVAAPLVDGSYDPAAHTEGGRIGWYFARAPGAEHIGHVVLGTVVTQTFADHLAVLGSGTLTHVTGVTRLGAGVVVADRIGLGVAPISSVGYATLAFLAGSLLGSATETLLGHNVWFDGTVFRRQQDGPAATLDVDDQGITLRVAASGLAGSTVSLSDILRTSIDGTVAILGSAPTMASGEVRFGGGDVVAHRDITAGGTVTATGGLRATIDSPVSASKTLAAETTFVVADAAVTLTIPAAACVDGRALCIRNIGTGTVTVVSSVGTVTSASIASADFGVYVFDGSDWQRLASGAAGGGLPPAYDTNLGATLTYDVNGRLDTKVTSLGSRTFGYDLDGKLVSIVGTGEYVSKTFGYDLSDRLTTITVS
jgi:hypothetical protein